MAEWVIAQQWLICLIVVGLLLSEYKFSRYLGGKLTYLLWLALPISLIIYNLPQHLVVPSSLTISHYVITMNEQVILLSSLISWSEVWIIGVVLTLFFSVYSKEHRLIIHSLRPIDSQSLPGDIPSELTVFTSKRVSSPVLTGIFNCKMILPADYQQLYSTQQLRLIIEHELCHYARRDNLCNFVAVAFLSCCWFNPIAWLGYKGFRRSQEMACDSQVLASHGNEQRIAYAKALLFCAEHHRYKLSIHSNYAQKNTMFERINLLKDYKLVNRRAQLIAVVTTSLVLSGVAVAAALPEPPASMIKVEQAQPTVRIEPRYPVQAARDGIEGSVVLKFDITQSGDVKNIIVVKSVPENVFDKEARRALKKWKYKSLSSGSGSRGHYVQLDFLLSKTSANFKSLLGDIERLKVVQ
ncbi:TonB family protein [Psychrobium sp. 1_MG-2023]|uniref:M56 family metallopeptidase n=1 Tax=Psychrobium sp. 1_MG-2023 TaxID=3062624 RepID=UPI000C33F555|nr:M56 family metallopeptidase [Psychrobium sp. 1_MG-2023]MDP2561142.1 M56 family metallopeptidase [Psychrobium sp. 1_MG-2023]PKF55117.1 hypothetical protein CW748_14230 [Alteromonadales bacterium alter-6D02]